MQPFVSVIIPFYGNPTELGCCLAALEHQSYSPSRFEVIVVDNGSPVPPLPDMRRHPHARIVQEPEPGSYRARNRGIQEAQGDVIAFTDADCVPASDWLERGAAHLATMQECGMVGGRIVMTTRIPGQPTLLERYDREFGLLQEFYVRSCHFAVTANLFTSASIIRTVGSFDGDLLSGGDREWGRRVFAAGHTQHYASDVIVLHPARSSVRAFIRKNRRTAGGMYQLWKKYPALGIHAPYRSSNMQLQVRNLHFGKKHGCLRPSFTGLTAAAWMIRSVEWIRLHLGGKPLRA